MTTPSSAKPQNQSTSGGRDASLMVSAGILLSRVLGLIRDKVFAHYLGTSDAAAAFRAALRIPNFLQYLFGEGILSASFIPVYSRLRAEGRVDEARTVAGIVGTALALAVSVLVLVGVWVTPAIVDFVAPGFHGELRALTTRIVRILFPGVGLLVLSAWCLGILNSHRRFFLPYVAPVFWNLALIATLFWYGHGSEQNDLAIYLAWGSVVGSFLQFAVQLPSVFSSAGRLRVSLAVKNGPARQVFANLGPVLVSRGVVQLSAYIDGMVASFLGALAVASLAYAQTLYLLPISLFGMAVAAAELPEMSSTGGDDSLEAQARLRGRLEAGQKKIAFFVIPSVVAFLLLGRQLVSLLFESGEFGPMHTIYVSYILIGSCVGLLAATWGRLYSSAFYALKDTRTPLRFALVRVATSVCLGILAAFPLRFLIARLFTEIPFLGLPSLPEIDLAIGAVGLSASTGIAGWMEFLLLKRALQKRIGEIHSSARHLTKIWGAAVAAAGAALVFVWFTEKEALIPTTRHEISALAAVAVFGILYLAFAIAGDVPEARALVNRVARRRK